MGEKLNLKEIEQSLKNIHFPAQRDELVQSARDAHVPQSVVNAISSIPDREYTSPLDAAKAFVSNEIKGRFNV